MFPDGRHTLIALVAAAAAGCAHFQTKAPVVVTSLAMPAPPARLLVPVELSAPPPEAPATTEEPAPPPAPAKPREPVSRPAATPAAPAAATPAAEPAAPPPVLQTATETSSQVQRIQAMLASAQQMLHNVSYKDLSDRARAQFDQALGYIRIANNAIKGRNYMYAEMLAGKASNIARLLVSG